MLLVPFISEQIIDTVAEKLDEDVEYFQEHLADMQAKQPILFSYLVSENFKLLTKDEQDYLLYLSLVIWKAIDNQSPNLERVESEEIEEVEEKNWAVLLESKEKRFRDKLDIFFDNYSQEDLLAFVEDALVDDEDNFITKEGRDLLFIGLKSCIDALCKT